MWYFLDPEWTLKAVYDNLYTIYFTCNFISDFLANFGYITKSGSVTWTLKMLPNIIMNNQHHIPIFCYLPHILAYIIIYGSALDPENIPQHCQQP